MRSFVTAMGLAFYRGECLFIPKEGTRRLAPMNAATLDPITSLQPKDHLQTFADTCDDAIADKRRIDEAVALFDYTATLRYEHDKGSEYAGQGAVKRGLGRLLHTEEAESWRWAHVVNDEEGARARLTATRADGKGDAHLDLDVLRGFDIGGDLRSGGQHHAIERADGVFGQIDGAVWTHPAIDHLPRSRVSIDVGLHDLA